jgi:hypothetical protein
VNRKPEDPSNDVALICGSILQQATADDFIELFFLATREGLVDYDPWIPVFRDPNLEPGLLLEIERIKRKANQEITDWISRITSSDKVDKLGVALHKFVYSANYYSYYYMQPWVETVTKRVIDTSCEHFYNDPSAENFEIKKILLSDADWFSNKRSNQQNA